MNGVIILALKKSAYYQAAANLAMSIKHFNKSINITLVTDGGHNEHFRVEHYAYFDWIKEIIYIGMTNSKGGLKNRLQQFDNTIAGKTGHGGAQRV